ncbi:hypothetical protein, partial [Nocardia abscessus]|uniref:hypothetical protein n=1 Tax=Nocardia abscessus TaxID=120957 RepID=UPI0024541931
MLRCQRKGDVLRSGGHGRRRLRLPVALIQHGAGGGGGWGAPPAGGGGGVAGGAGGGGVDG